MTCRIRSRARSCTQNLPQQARLSPRASTSRHWGCARRSSTASATTICERWDGIRPDGTFQNVGMNSFSPYAYGAIGDWMYQVVVGSELEPGDDFGTPDYRPIRLQPPPGCGLTHASAS